MQLLDGKKVSEELKKQIALDAAEMLSKTGRKPHLVAILVGNDGGSETYVASKIKNCEQVGFKSTLIRFGNETSEETLLTKIKELNQDDDVDGFIVQLPLPKHIDADKITEAIDYKKDVDGFHPINVGNLSSGKDSLISCTPLGCYLMIKSIKKNLSGLNALMIGRSSLNGKPMVQLLLKEDCTVTIGHSKTKNLKELCKKADIVVVAAGRANLVKGDWIKKGAIVIDVGINRVKKKNGYKIIGDVEFKSVVKKAKAITPVPGGVGPVTIACLLKNTLKAFKNINYLSSK